MSANEVRGEVSLELEGVTYVLRPSFEAIVAIEKATGSGLLELADRAAGARLTLTEVGQIAAECIRAHARAIGDDMMGKVNDRRIAELVIGSEMGFVLAVRTLAVLLFGAATGGYTATGEAKATTKTSENPAVA